MIHSDPQWSTLQIYNLHFEYSMGNILEIRLHRRCRQPGPKLDPFVWKQLWPKLRPTWFQHGGHGRPNPKPKKHKFSLVTGVGVKLCMLVCSRAEMVSSCGSAAQRYESLCLLQYVIVGYSKIVTFSSGFHGFWVRHQVCSQILSSMWERGWGGCGTSLSRAGVVRSRTGLAQGLRYFPSNEMVETTARTAGCGCPHELIDSGHNFGV
jgi:hypothetical protein